MNNSQPAGGQREMTTLTANLGTKSAKIRSLGQAGYTRRQIADFLGIRYQFVRNVLVEAERRAKAAATTPPGGRQEAQSDSSVPQPDPHQAFRVEIGPDGEVRLPKHLLGAAGTGPGRHLLARFDDDEIKLVTPEATSRKIHAWARKHVPEGVSLVEELLAERRREFEREERESKA